MQQLEPIAGFHLRDQQMRERTHSRRAVCQFTRAAARKRDQIRHRLNRQRRMHRQHARHQRQHRDRCEVAHRVVGHVRIERRIRGVGRLRRHAQRITVRRSLRHQLRAKRAAGTNPVLGHHRLTQPPRKVPGEQARNQVRTAAGFERNDEVDRPLGPGRGRRAHGRTQRSKRNCTQRAEQQPTPRYRPYVHGV
jgi:hypothetical protein